MAPSNSRTQLFSDLEDKPVIDYDPEDDVHGASSSDEQEDNLAGTEHYVSVGESKLRQPASASLGPKYNGTRVSRAALDESSDDDQLEDSDEDEDEDGDEEGSEDFDDPETANMEADDDGDDDDIDSDEAFGEGDEQRFRKFTFSGSSNKKKTQRAAAKSEESESDDEDLDGKDVDVDESVEDSDNESESMNGTSLANGFGSEDDEEDDNEDEEAEFSGSEEADGHADDKYNAVASIAKLSNAEAERGAAIRTQRRHFDSLLNIRIRLQKALVAMNSIPSTQADDDSGSEPYQAAEDAALKLWQTIDGFRESLVLNTLAKPGEKRKREVTSETANETIWEMINDIESKASSRRKKRLQFWSEKTQGLSDVVKSRKVISAKVDSIVSVLDDQLLNGERLIKRTRTPRSCAPVQAAKKIEQDPDIYDDADFYQLLLKELVDQRKGDSGAPGSALPTVRWAAIKEAKTRKHVDRKASKGRKMRYNVHEKIQNFMAPEDRRTWEPEAVDRFFATLFGKRTELVKEVKDVEMAGAPADGQGLRLFG